jgi:hypothetical protein
MRGQPDWLAERVRAWTEECQRSGPPSSSVRLYEDDDLYVHAIRGTAVGGVALSVVFLVVVDERLMIIKDFGND